MKWRSFGGGFVAGCNHEKQTDDGQANGCGRAEFRGVVVGLAHRIVPAEIQSERDVEGGPKCGPWRLALRCRWILVEFGEGERHAPQRKDGSTRGKGFDLRT